MLMSLKSKKVREGKENVVALESHFYLLCLGEEASVRALAGHKANTLLSATSGCQCGLARERGEWGLSERT